MSKDRVGKFSFGRKSEKKAVAKHERIGKENFDNAKAVFEKPAEKAAAAEKGKKTSQGMIELPVETDTNSSVKTSAKASDSEQGKGKSPVKGSWFARRKLQGTESSQDASSLSFHGTDDSNRSFWQRTWDRLTGSSRKSSLEPHSPVLQDTKHSSDSTETSTKNEQDPHAIKADALEGIWLKFLNEKVMPNKMTALRGDTLVQQIKELYGNVTYGALLPQDYSNQYREELPGYQKDAILRSSKFRNALAEDQASFIRTTLDPNRTPKTPKEIARSLAHLLNIPKYLNDVTIGLNGKDHPSNGGRYEGLVEKQYKSAKAYGLGKEAARELVSYMEEYTPYSIGHDDAIPRALKEMNKNSLEGISLENMKPALATIGIADCEHFNSCIQTGIMDIHYATRRQALNTLRDRTRFDIRQFYQLETSNNSKEQDGDQDSPRTPREAETDPSIFTPSRKQMRWQETAERLHTMQGSARKILPDLVPAAQDYIENAITYAEGKSEPGTPVAQMLNRATFKDSPNNMDKLVGSLGMSLIEQLGYSSITKGQTPSKIQPKGNLKPEALAARFAEGESIEIEEEKSTSYDTPSSLDLSHQDRALLAAIAQEDRKAEEKAARRSQENSFHTPEAVNKTLTTPPRRRRRDSEEESSVLTPPHTEMKKLPAGKGKEEEHDDRRPLPAPQEPIAKESPKEEAIANTVASSKPDSSAADKKPEQAPRPDGSPRTTLYNLEHIGFFTEKYKDANQRYKLRQNFRKEIHEQVKEQTANESSKLLAYTKLAVQNPYESKYRAELEKADKVTTPLRKAYFEKRDRGADWDITKDLLHALAENEIARKDLEIAKEKHALRQQQLGILGQGSNHLLNKEDAPSTHAAKHSRSRQRGKENKPAAKKYNEWTDANITRYTMKLSDYNERRVVEANVQKAKDDYEKAAEQAYLNPKEYDRKKHDFFNAAFEAYYKGALPETERSKSIASKMAGEAYDSEKNATKTIENSPEYTKIYINAKGKHMIDVVIDRRTPRAIREHGKPTVSATPPAQTFAEKHSSRHKDSHLNKQTHTNIR